MTVVATVKDATGNPISGTVVTFTSDDTNATLIPSSGKALTDKNGIASVAIGAATPQSRGAVTVTAASNGGQATLGFSIYATSVVDTSGAAYLQYVGTTTARLFVSGAASGVNNAAEQTTVTFKVLNSSNQPVSQAAVVFDVTKRNGNILTNGSSTPVTVTSGSDGTASVVVKSGTLPLSVNVIGTLPSSPNPSAQYLSNDQIVISSNRPDQSRLQLYWAPGDSCTTGALNATRTYPCTLSVAVYDINGQPVADGTVVNFVSSTGGVNADILAGQPSGACLTTDSKCSIKYTSTFGGNGNQVIVAYLVGDNAPQNKPITKDGSWVVSGANVMVNTPDSNNYIRICIPDATDKDSTGAVWPAPNPRFGSSSNTCANP